MYSYEDAQQILALLTSPFITYAFSRSHCLPHGSQSASEGPASGVTNRQTRCDRCVGERCVCYVILCLFHAEFVDKPDHLQSFQKCYLSISYFLHFSV